jgi:hypothetical protein
MCIPPDDGCLVRPKHVAMCIYDYCNKGCVLSDCIFIDAYYNVPSVLTNEFVKNESCHYRILIHPDLVLIVTKCVSFLCSVHSDSRYHLTSRRLEKTLRIYI